MDQAPRTPQHPAPGRDEVRVASYAVCHRDADVLLVRASSQTLVEGRWFLPGGGVDFGEHPEDAALRELTEETGLLGAAPRLLGILTDLRRRRVGGRLSSIRVIYAVDVVGGELRHEVDGTSDRAQWFAPGELAALPLADYVPAALVLSTPK